MPRKYARLHVTIWQDSEYQELDPYHQGVYSALIAYPNVSWCGVIDYIPKRLTIFSDSMTASGLALAVEVLEKHNFVYVDEDTDELVIRTFIRHDGVMHQKNMGKAMITALRKVQSVYIQNIVLGELINLYRLEPDLKGWEGFQELAPDTYDEVVWAASQNPNGNPSANPNGNP
jgi:hypothetical protein